MKTLDTIDNISLIENCLSHIGYELSKGNTSYFRIARESHLCLYRAMIEALKGTANIAVTGKPSKKRVHIYSIGDDRFKEIHKIKINSCKRAWRFSEPVYIETPPTFDQGDIKTDSEDYLIPFYDALAMVQVECFMTQYIHSKPIRISDDEMKLLEWLHEAIRNDYEHFVPRLYAAPIDSLINVSFMCLKLTKDLLFGSGNVWIFKEERERAILQLIDSVTQKLTATMNRRKVG